MLRSYTPADLEPVLDVWRRASKIAHDFLSDEFLAVERELIATEWLPASETSVYEHDGHVVGFLSLVENEVSGFFVDPAHQGKGFGRALMDAARDSRPFLELGVFEANTLGRRFYDTYGFAIVDRVTNEATGEPELRMRYEFGSRT